MSYLSKTSQYNSNTIASNSKQVAKQTAYSLCRSSIRHRFHTSTNRATIDLCNTLQQNSALYQRSLKQSVENAPKRTLKKTIPAFPVNGSDFASNMRAYHYSQYNHILRKKQIRSMRTKFGYYKTRNNPSKQASNSKLINNAANKTKLLTVGNTKQIRYLPVRRFDTIAVDLGMAEFALQTPKKRYVALLPPPPTRIEYLRQLLRIYIPILTTNVRNIGPKAMNIANHKFVMYPLLMGSLFAMIKSVFADLFAQTTIDRKSLQKFNWHRNALFAFVGMFLIYFCYLQLYVVLNVFVLI